MVLVAYYRKVIYDHVNQFQGDGRNDEFENGYDDMDVAYQRISSIQDKSGSEGGIDPLDIANPTSAYFFLNDLCIRFGSMLLVKILVAVNLQKPVCALKTSNIIAILFKNSGRNAVIRSFLLPHLG